MSWCLLLWSSGSAAEVSFDHTNVVSSAFRGQTLNGIMKIPASAGTQLGGNLFHSFDRFNINTGEKAIFTNTGALGAIHHVIGRVTGDSASTIDGVLRSNIVNADVYLLNPHGVIFGNKAKIDVQGTFHLSTAAYLKFSDGAKFTVLNPNDTVLTMAEPQAFGFLDGVAASKINGNRIHQAGGNLDFVAGNISVENGGYLYGTNEIRLVAQHGAGEVSVQRDANGNLPLPSQNNVTQGGDITLDGGYLGVIADGGGRIALWAKAVSLLNSSVVGIWNTGAIDANPVQGINIQANSLQVDSNSQIITPPLASGRAANIEVNSNIVDVLNGGLMSSHAAAGDAGDIHVRADSLTIDGKQQFASISSEADEGSSGNAGQLNIEVGTATLLNNGQISSLTRGSGHAGNVFVSADKLTINGENSQTIVGIASDTLNGTGYAGEVIVNAAELVILSGGRISSLTKNKGHAGDVSIVANNLTIDGKNSTLKTGITSDTESSGNAESVKINAQILTLVNGGQISSDTSSIGNADDILIAVSERITLDNYATISSSSTSDGLSGSIRINSPAALLTLNHNSKIAASSLTQAKSGDIIINASQINVSNHSSITALNSGSGDAGKIAIKATGLDLKNNSAITVASAQGNAGSITLAIKNKLSLLDSQITTTAGGGVGNGGNIVITYPEFTVLNNSDVIANALLGNGGDIDMFTNFFLPSADSTIQASSEFGLQGSVSIQSTNSNIAGSIAVLSARFNNISALLQEGCSKRNAGNSSSFIVASAQTAVLATPDIALNYLPSSLKECTTASDKK